MRTQWQTKSTEIKNKVILVAQIDHMAGMYE